MALIEKNLENFNSKKQTADSAEDETNVLKFSQVPKHLGIIPDGNRRWAKENGVSSIKAMEITSIKVAEILDHLLTKTSIQSFTVWAISTENLERPEKEVEGLLNGTRIFLREFVPIAKKHGCSIRRIGNPAKIPEDILKITDNPNQNTKNNRTVNVAMDYGGKWDILNAINQCIKQNPGKTEITENDINHYVEILKDNIPEPDLIIRTGAESECKRTSGFFSWQSIYSEFYFMDKMIPDITFKDVAVALESFSKTKRTFGK